MKTTTKTPTERLRVKAQILSCTACALSSRCTAPVPFSGPTPASLAIVGEAPGRVEDEKGEPFVGPAGQYLKKTLEEFDLPTDRVFINVVSCFPTDFEGKGRTPNATEVTACAQNLKDQLSLANPRYVLLTGGVPLKALRPSLKISTARGKPFLLDSSVHSLGTTLCMATYHPSYVIRSGGEGTSADVAVREDLGFFRRLIQAGEEHLRLFPDSCVECQELASHFAVDGLGFCEKHWKPDGKLKG